MSRKIVVGTIALNTFAVFIIALLNYFGGISALNLLRNSSTIHYNFVIQNLNLMLIFAVVALLINTGIISYLYNKTSR